MNKLDIKEGVTLVQFSAEWCGPCKMLTPYVNEVLKENEGINYIKIDVDEDRELAQEYEIRNVPTLLFYKDGELYNKHVGFLPKPLLEKIVHEGQKQG